MVAALPGYGRTIFILPRPMTSLGSRMKAGHALGMRGMWPALRAGERRRRTSLAAACLFVLQLVLAGLAPLLAAPPASAAGLPVPICTDGHLAWVDPTGLPGQDEPEDRSKTGSPGDCAKCCPHVVNALLPPAPGWLVQRRMQRQRRSALPRLAVRVGRPTARPPPSRAPPHVTH
jgi:hypothetical protein